MHKTLTSLFFAFYDSSRGFKLRGQTRGENDGRKLKIRISGGRTLC